MSGTTTNKYLALWEYGDESPEELEEALHDKITNVIFNDPATIVFWGDGTKTVVKCQGDDVFDPEKGLAMAIAKKFYGNKGSYCNQIKPWIEKYEEECEVARIVAEDIKKVDNVIYGLGKVFTKIGFIASSAVKANHSLDEAIKATENYALEQLEVYDKDEEIPKLITSGYNHVCPHCDTILGDIGFFNCHPDIMWCSNCGKKIRR